MISRRHRHKFNARTAVSHGTKFASQKEARYYADVLLLVRSGHVLFFLRQVPFHLPGGVTYRCDFAVFYSDGIVRFIDVKGMKTRSFIDKKKMVEDLYPVEIETA